MRLLHKQYRYVVCVCGYVTLKRKRQKRESESDEYRCIIHSFYYCDLISAWRIVSVVPFFFCCSFSFIYFVLCFSLPVGFSMPPSVKALCCTVSYTPRESKGEGEVGAYWSQSLIHLSTRVESSLFQLRLAKLDDKLEASLCFQFKVLTCLVSCVSLEAIRRKVSIFFLN